ncbi:MAG: hypothetical protein ACK41O_16540 [Runella zeae]
MSEFRDKLKHGDVTRIAEMAGVHFQTVRKTLLYGTRNNEKVKEVAEKYLNARQAITNGN